jgi:uncharacterized membrane protein
MSKNVCKTGTYSLMHMIVAITVAYVLSGNWHIALAIGLVEPIFQTAAYFIHERMWEKVALKSGKTA